MKRDFHRQVRSKLEFANEERLPRRVAADTLPAMILERIPEIIKLPKAGQPGFFGELGDLPAGDDGWRELAPFITSNDP